jgi:hypothetical protein
MVMGALREPALFTGSFADATGALAGAFLAGGFTGGCACAATARNNVVTMPQKNRIFNALPPKHPSAILTEKGGTARP